MHPFPHHYTVSARAAGEKPVTLTSPGLATLETAPPPEFGGPGDCWSPEGLLIASAVDCFVLTFRGIAGASKYAWTRLECESDGVLERVDGVTRFTSITIGATLFVPEGSDRDKGVKLLEKAEQTCLVMNSLAFPATLEPEVAVEQGAGVECSD